MKQSSDVNMAGVQALSTAPGPLFRAGGLLGTQRFKPVSKEVLDLDQSARLALIPGYHVATGGPVANIGISVLEGVPSLQLPVAAFEPAEGDVLSRSWTSSAGESKTIELPPYAAQDVVDAGKRFDKHIRDNALEWASRQGGAISAVAALAQANDKTLAYASLFPDCAALMFCAAHKTGSASLDPSTTDEEVLARSSVVDDQGYPLRGKVSMPRMVLYQLDAVLTLQTCCDLQERLVADLATLREQPGGDLRKAWQHYFLVLAALCTNGTVIFKDQRRRAVDNHQQEEYSVPESVQDISKALDALIAQFHDWEAEKKGDLNREEAAASAEPFYYATINRGESGEGREIENLDLWMQKLRA